MNQIFVHGLGQSASVWDKTVSGLTDQNNVVCPNLAALMEGNEFTCESTESIRICGLSLGVVIALHFALDHPEKVSSLILIAPQYKMPKTLL